MLDWIAQVHGKIWCSPQILYDLVSAFYVLLRPQKNYCGFGIHQTVPNVKDIIPSAAERTIFYA